MDMPANRDSGAGCLRARFARNGQPARARLALLSGTALVGAAFCIATSATPALACSPEPCTWGGGGGNGLWSNPVNWTGGNGPPGTGDSVVLTNSGNAPSTNDNNVGERATARLPLTRMQPDTRSILRQRRDFDFKAAVRSPTATHCTQIRSVAWAGLRSPGQ